MKVLTFLIVAIRVIFVIVLMFVEEQCCPSVLFSFFPLLLLLHTVNTYAFTCYAFSWCECVTHHIKRLLVKADTQLYMY